MKLFKPTLMVLAFASTNAFALEAMDDTTLSSATGQDGISIELSTPDGITIEEVYIHDKDGVNGNGLTGIGGAIVLGNGADSQLKVITTNTVVNIDADGGSDTSKGATLNVGLKLGATKITTGEIGVAKSKRGGLVAGELGTARGIDGSYNKILSSLDIDLNSGSELNIQLGGQYQTGGMINLSGLIKDGLVIDNLELADSTGDKAGTNNVYGGGAIKVGRITVKSSGSTNLTLDTRIDVTTDGLRIANNSTLKTDLMLEDIRLGDVTKATSSIGDIEVVGISGGGIMHIRGH